jgi:NTP pyrophosphatase (non-canonical NTP hydrolase)
MDFKTDEGAAFIPLDSLSQIMEELDELSSEIQRLIQNIHLLLMRKVEFGDTLAKILIAIGYLVERIELNLGNLRRFMFEFTRTLYRVMTVMHRNLIAEHISLTKVMSDIYEDTKELNEAKET